MGRMTEETISALYGYGKKVFAGELPLDEASQQVHAEHSEVATSSARHYISWYGKMRSGDFLTWNTNSSLILYYAKHIIEEEGIDAGKLAIQAGNKFAEHASRHELENELRQLSQQYGISFEDNHLPKDTSVNNKETFKEWLKTNKKKNYTENTIYRYVRAIEQAGNWLSIDLPKAIFSIEDLSEFSELDAMIRSNPSFNEINQSHGHGDLSAALSLYNEFLSHNEIEGASDWWPSLSEYTPGFTKEKWLEILNNRDVIGPVWGKALAMFYTEKDGATCSDVAKKFSYDMGALRSNCVQLAMRIHRMTNCPLVNNGKKDQYWPILFLGKAVGKGGNGVYSWKLRSELYEALTEFNILRYLNRGEGRGVKMSTKEAVSQIGKYIASNGFTYSNGLIENFYLSLKSKPFVILAGISGTGKTRLVRLFAEAMGAKMQMVPVRPDWSDSSDLFGHLDLTGRFHPGEIIDFVLEASNNPDVPYLLCLDEMNLARVEYYLSDYLSIIETRENDGDSISSDTLLSNQKFGNDETAKSKYGGLCLPENLYVIGTVNMDETTFPFSKKVLDRANTIEFSDVDLMPDFTGADNTAEVINIGNDFLKTEYLKLIECQDESDYLEKICSELVDINEKLKKANAHVGYRVRDEIVFYMLNNKKAELLTENEAMDNEIMQKILPRIQGSSTAVKEMLCDLFKMFWGDYQGYQTAGNNLFEQMEKALVSNSGKYPKSSKKIAFMVRRFEEDGFTSYWL